jgi:hypothetical protein
VIEVVVVAGGAVFMVVGVVLALAANSRDEQKHERERPLRRIRTLEQELGLEPHPLGPLDAPDVPTASPVRHDTVEQERAARIEAMVTRWRQDGR